MGARWSAFNVDAGLWEIAPDGRKAAAREATHPVGSSRPRDPEVPAQRRLKGGDFVFPAAAGAKVSHFVASVLGH
jgi:hypothetical protein